MIDKLILTEKFWALKVITIYNISRTPVFKKSGIQFEKLPKQWNREKRPFPNRAGVSWIQELCPNHL